MFSLGSDRIFSILLICLSAVAFVIVGGGEEVNEVGAFNTATYPRILLALLIAFCAVHVISKQSGKVKSSFSFKELVVIVVILIYIFLLNYIGYFILTPVILFVLPILYGYRKYAVILLSIALIMAFLYSVFSLLLKVPLP